MSVFRRPSRGGAALVPDIIEAARLGDRPRDSISLLVALTLRKLTTLGLPLDFGNHTVRICTHGMVIEMDVWAAEHRPLREIVARDEYGLFHGGLLEPGDNVIDVGANVGIFSLFAATYVGSAGRVVAYEPHPTAFERLVRNVTRNHLSEVIKPINKAASDRPGDISFDPSSMSVENRIEAAGSMIVPAVALDDDPAVAGLSSVGLMKIDVEGHEAAVLAGGPGVLSRTRAIVVEYHSETAQEAVMRTLDRSGFIRTSHVAYRHGLGLISARRP